MRRGPAVILLIALLLALGYGAQRAALLGWDRITGFAPAYFGAELPATGTPPVAGRLILILLDGLRTEDAPLLPSLEWLRENGSAFSLSVPAPTYGAPVVATLLTGSLPAYHGVMIDAFYRPLRADHLLAAAGRVNITTGAAGSHLLGALLGSGVKNWRELPGPKLLEASSMLQPDGPRLALLQSTLLHDAGHRLKAASADNAEYRKLLAELDALLVQLLGSIDLKSTAVMVTGTLPTSRLGDHPPSARVPLILAGAGIRKGLRGEGSLMDIAPTAAVLLGAPAPMQHRGRPLIEALTLEGRPIDLVAARQAAVRKSFADALLRSLGQVELTPDAPASAAESVGYLASLDDRVRAVQFQTWRHGLLQRLPCVGGAILLLVIYLLIAFRQPFSGAILMGTLTYLLTFHAALFLTGGWYSTNMTGLESLSSRMAANLGLRTALAMSLSVAVGGYFLSRRPFRQTGYLAGAALHSALATAAVVALPMVSTVLVVGWEFPVGLPSPSILVWFFITCSQILIIGYLSPVWALLTVWLVRFYRHLWPIKEVGDPERNADKVVRMQTLKRSRKAPPPRRK